jgi:hypothetical protein
VTGFDGEQAAQLATVDVGSGRGALRVGIGNRQFSDAVDRVADTIAPELADVVRAYGQHPADERFDRPERCGWCDMLGSVVAERLRQRLHTELNGGHR